MRPRDHIRRVALTACLTAALHACGNESTAVGADGPPPTTVPARDLIAVVDGSGALRGYADESRRASRADRFDGRRYVEVVDGRGDVVGYLFDGLLGFVDRATAEDSEELAQLESCYERLSEDSRPSEDCRTALARQGVNPPS